MIANLILYIIISLSFSYMWSFSEIFRPVRNFVAKIILVNKMLLCPECSSFWIGIFTVLFIYNPFILEFKIINAIVCGLINHLIASILYKKIL
jgi:uncharacterized membrane protein